MSCRLSVRKTAVRCPKAYPAMGRVLTVQTALFALYLV